MNAPALNLRAAPLRITPEQAEAARYVARQHYALRMENDGNRITEECRLADALEAIDALEMAS